MTRKTITVFFIGIIAIILFLLFGILINRNDTSESDISHQENQENTKSKALHAYIDFLSQEKYANENSDMMKTYFAISDLDADKTPELLISEDSNILSINEYYTYDNDTVTDIKGPMENTYPAYGSLIPQPSRGTYIYFRGGPGYTDEEDGNNYMPYTLMEYKLENHKIHMINHAFWQTCKSGDKAGTTEYTLNEKKCSAEKIENQYQLKNDAIELLPNTDANRKKFLSEISTVGQTP